MALVLFREPIFTPPSAEPEPWPAFKPYVGRGKEMILGEDCTVHASTRCMTFSHPHFNTKEIDNDIPCNATVFFRKKTSKIKGTRIFPSVYKLHTSFSFLGIECKNFSQPKRRFEKSPKRRRIPVQTLFSF